MMSSFRKSAKPIMLVVAIIFVITGFYGFGWSRRRSDPTVTGDGGEFFQDYDVAIINGERISRSRLEYDVAHFIHEMGLHASATSADLPVFRNAVIDRIATLQELDKEIISRRIVVAKEEIDVAIREIEDQYPTKEIYLRQLQASGITETELRNQIEETLKRNKVFEEITGLASTDEEELRNFYEMMKSYAFQRPEGFMMDVARFTTEETAENARKELESGKEWDDVMEAVSPDVSEHSRSYSRIFIPTNQLIDEVEFVVDLSIGVPSRVVSFTSDDHMIVVKRAKEEAGTAPFEEVSADIEQMIISQKSAAQQSQFMQELRARAVVEFLDEELFTMVTSVIAEDESADETTTGETTTDETTVSDETSPADPSAPVALPTAIPEEPDTATAPEETEEESTAQTAVSTEETTASDEDAPVDTLTETEEESSIETPDETSEDGE